MPEALFHPPAWVLFAGSEGGLQVRDLARGDGFDVRGELGWQLRVQPGEAVSALHAMGAFDATIARFAAQLEPHRLEPLTRAALLRGAGFDQLFVELTARCNERCVHCYASSSPDRHETLEGAILGRALDDARALGFRGVQLTGGDPLLSPHCVDAARRVRELGFERLEIYTNGLLLRGALYAALRALRPAFAFSFYSADPDVHDAVTRTPGSQARTLDAIRRVVADGLPVRASVVVNSATVHTVEATLALLERVGVPRHSIAVDQERAVGRGVFDAPLSLGNWQQMARSAHVEGAWPRVEGLSGKAAISPEGLVFPCIFSRKQVLGDLRRASLGTILGDPRPLPVPAETVLREASASVDQLTCWECRFRSAALQCGDSDRLTPLTRRSRPGDA